MDSEQTRRNNNKCKHINDNNDGNKKNYKSNAECGQGLGRRGQRKLPEKCLLSRRFSMVCNGFMRIHTIPYHTIPYYTIPYYTILYYTILYYTILCYTILYSTLLYSTLLYPTLLYYVYYTIYYMLYYAILDYTRLY